MDRRTPMIALVTLWMCSACEYQDYAYLHGEPLRLTLLPGETVELSGVARAHFDAKQCDAQAAVVLDLVPQQPPPLPPASPPGAEAPPVVEDAPVLLESTLLLAGNDVAHMNEALRRDGRTTALRMPLDCPDAGRDCTRDFVVRLEAVGNEVVEVDVEPVISAFFDPWVPNARRHVVTGELTLEPRAGNDAR